MAGKPTLNELFLALHDRLACELGITRRTVKHNATMGAVSEDQWIKMLYEHLPKRYKVNRAFVIDSKGECSKQIDIVVHDRQYSPFVLNYGGALYVPAESVYAVFDVKQCMNADEMKDTAEKVASVRALHRTSIDIPTASGVLKAKPPHYILGGVLTVDCDWCPPFGAPFTSAINTTSKEGRLDLGCCAQHGAFEVKYTEPDSAEIIVECSASALALFLLTLIDRLRSIATVPAIDILAYASSIERKTQN
ncbi:MAG: hypothetical protein KF866_02095 [Phycisphaeraceae bacterium]|nr:hypothetical protein [Phycisphaeraceae bacterium]